MFGFYDSKINFLLLVKFISKKTIRNSFSSHEFVSFILTWNQILRNISELDWDFVGTRAGSSCTFSA